VKNLKWSDNTGSVGWTSIHAVMSVQDMDNLLRWCPQGHFTNTFLSTAWPDHKSPTPDLVADAMATGKLDARTTWAFYFTFPLDEAGRGLLDILGADWTKAQFARDAFRKYGP